MHIQPRLMVFSPSEWSTIASKELLCIMNIIIVHGWPQQHHYSNDDCIHGTEFHDKDTHRSF